MGSPLLGSAGLSIINFAKMETVINGWRLPSDVQEWRTMGSLLPALIALCHYTVLLSTDGVLPLSHVFLVMQFSLRTEKACTSWKCNDALQGSYIALSLHMLS